MFRQICCGCYSNLRNKKGCIKGLFTRIKLHHKCRNFSTTSATSNSPKPLVFDKFVSLDIDGNDNWHFAHLHKYAENYLNNLSDELLEEKAKVDMLLNVLKAEGLYEYIDFTPHDLWILVNYRKTNAERQDYINMRYRDKYCRLERLNRQKEVIEKIKRPLDDEDLNFLENGYRMQKHQKAWNALAALKFGRPLIIDMGYEYNYHESTATFRHIDYMYRLNCLHNQPFHLVFTSALENIFMKNMIMEGRNMLADFYKEPLLEVFPREKLFYLVSEGAEIQEEQLSDDTIFVVGGLANTSERRRSLSKAVKNGIRYGSIPITSYVRMKQRSSIELRLPLVMSILLDKFAGFTWKEVLEEHLPDSLYQKYPFVAGRLSEVENINVYKQYQVLAKNFKLLKP